ncbi:MAG: EamA family transporter [Gammaproteobacteria bacterium]|nr:EamA family transporter [Gammaproteobacteria bacterium]
MSMLGLALVLLAACCHATWNLYVKRINAGPELVWLFSVVSVVIYLPVAVLVWIFEQPDLGPLELGFIGGSAALHLGYFLLLQRGYRFGDLSVVYPTARATGPLLSSGFAVLVLGEQLSAQALLGVVAIVGGVLLLSGGLSASSHRVSRSLLFGLAVGALIGGYTVWDAYAVATLMIPPLLLDYVSSIGRTLLLAPLAARRKAAVRTLWREQRFGVLCIALLSPLAYILVLYALTFTPVVYVAPAREVSVPLSVLLGAWLLGEPDLRRRLVWAAVVFAGVVLLASG